MPLNRSDIRRWAPAVLTLSALLAATGCGHRRSSMRPVMVTPPPTLIPSAVDAAPCASGNCGSTSVRVTPGNVEEGTVVIPAAPATVAPSGTSPLPPPAGSGTEDIDLKPAGATTSGPALNGPIGRRTDRTTSAKVGGLRSKLEPFVNDPADLFQPPKADRRWTYIVLHESGQHSGSLAQVDRVDREALGTQGAGVHFVIGNGTETPDGSIEVARRWSEQKGGAHARDARSTEINDYGIGITLVGDFNQEKPTPKQVEAARALVAYLRDRYEIDLDHVGTHGEFSKSASTCPGIYFPTSEVTGARRQLTTREAARVRVTGRRNRFW